MAHHPAREVVAHWIVRTRKSRWVQHIKWFIPSSLRRLAWRTAISRSHFEVLGSRIFIPVEARNKSLLLNEYEPEVTECIRSVLKEGMTFCDVGANIGVFTLFASRLVGSSGRVIAFEPIPENACVLRENIARNGCRNVLVLQKAAAEKTGGAEIHLSALCGCHSLISRPDGSTGGTLSVETIRLDEVPELTSVDLLKIDAEGAELSVLRSLGIRRPRHLILEYNGPRTRAAGYTGSQFLAQLSALGYSKIMNLDQPESGLRGLEEDTCEATNLHAQYTGRPW
jgi:FkbM family methyltransferase